MKKIKLLTISFILFYFYIGFAQQDLLNGGNKWLLHHMIIDGNTINVPQSTGLPSYNSGIQFSGTQASDYNFTAGIAGNINAAFDLQGPIVINLDSFTINFPSITLGDCNPNCTLENQYLNTIILGNSNSTRTLDYEIIEESNGNKRLIIDTPEGNKAVHTNYVLSSKKFYKEHVVMYPNPVKNTLFFDFKGFQVKKLSVLSIVGTSIFEKEILSQDNSVDLSFLSPGVYFMKTTYKDGDTFVSKFIKE